MAERGDAAPGAGGRADEEGAREEDGVVAPLAQRRKRDRDDREAVVEVLAERPGRDHGREVPVGRGDDPRIRSRRRAAERGHGPFLDRAEELGLEVQGKLADLVEEEGPAVRLAEATGLGRRGAGEGALLVPEELALDERLGQGAAVDDDEGPRGARREVVDPAGEHLLAGPGLARDEDRESARGDAAGELEDPRHGRALREELRAAEVLAERRVLGLEALLRTGGVVGLGALEARALDRHGALGGERLEELELGGPEAVGAPRAVHVEDAEEPSPRGERDGEDRSDRPLEDAGRRLSVLLRPPRVGEDDGAPVLEGAGRHRSRQELARGEVPSLPRASRDGLEHARGLEEDRAARALPEDDRPVEDPPEKLVGVGDGVDLGDRREEELDVPAVAPRVARERRSRVLRLVGDKELARAELDHVARRELTVAFESATVDCGRASEFPEDELPVGDAELEVQGREARVLDPDRAVAAAADADGTGPDLDRRVPPAGSPEDQRPRHRSGA